VHAMPAVQDMRRSLPSVQIDWVVEKAFAPLVREVQGIGRVIPCELRKWRHTIRDAETRQEWAAFRAELAGADDFPGYDAVIDAQGLTKSAFVASFAARSENGKRYSLGNRTEGSSWERPTRWLSDLPIKLPVRTDAIQRTRLLCAKALGYSLDGLPLDYGLLKPEQKVRSSIKQIALVHGTSRADKLWPEENWIALALKFRSLGYRIVLPHGGDEEMARAKRISAGIFAAAKNTPHNAVTVWPRMPLHLLADALGGCWGVVGVDSGLSHIATALDLPHVQLYNFDTAWRTGPVLLEAAPQGARQVSLVSPGATPKAAGRPLDVDAVWRAWLRVGE
jgi:heptosyltransferase I